MSTPTPDFSYRWREWQIKVYFGPTIGRDARQSIGDSFERMMLTKTDASDVEGVATSLAESVGAIVSVVPPGGHGDELHQIYSVAFHAQEEE